MKKLNGRLIETEKELLKRINYGTQLKMMMAVSNTSVEDLKPIVKNIETILNNSRFPNSNLEKRLMVKLKYIPLYTVVVEHAGETDENGEAAWGLTAPIFFTVYEMLQWQIARMHLSVNQVKDYMEKNGGRMSTSLYSALRGNQLSLNGLNTMLAYLNLRVNVTLQPATKDLFLHYVESLKTVARDTGIYDKSIEVLTNVDVSIFEDDAGVSGKDKMKPAKEMKLLDCVEQFKNIDFCMLSDHYGKNDYERVFSAYTAPVRNQFGKFSLTALEAMMEASGNRCYFTVFFDPVKVESKIKRGKLARRCKTINEMIKFMGMTYWGADWEHSIPSTLTKVYNHEQHLRVAGLNQICEWYNARVRISIV